MGMSKTPIDRSHDATRRLETYLRDHFAGSTSGLALAKRCRESNAGTGYEPLLVALESEIDEDRQSLRAIMSRLGVTPSEVKSAIGAIGEVVGRLKTNGHFREYSPASRLIELEMLAAGITTKRNLWRALRVAARPELASDELDRLISRATSQLERVRDGHERAAAEALN
jgi:hypothetical protein